MAPILCNRINILANIQKKRGVLLVTHPTPEALALPYPLNEQRRSPRLYVYINHNSIKSIDLYYYDLDITYPWTSLLLYS